MEDIGQMELQVVMLEAIQGIIAKVQKEWQTYKQEIAKAIQKVERKVDQSLVEAKIDNVEYNMNQIQENALVFEHWIYL